MTEEPPIGWLFFGPYMVPKPRKLFIADIQDRVAHARGTTRADMLSARRDKDTALSRHVAMYLARKLTLSSLPEIGRRFGGRDHSTVMSGISRIEGLIEADDKLDGEIKALAATLRPQT